MTTDSSTSSTNTKSRSSDRTAKYKLLGALTVGSPGKLPTFSVHPDRERGCGLILPCDPEHPAYSPTKLWRYKRDNPKIQALMKSILVEGIHPLQVHELPELGKNYVYASDGGRRGVCLRYLQEDLAQNPDLQGVPHGVTVDISFDSTLEAFNRSYRVANIKREDDDPMTVAEKIIAALEGDVAGVPPLSKEQAMEEFEMKEYDLNRHIQVYKTGSARLVEAVARKIVPLPQAHVTVGLCPGDHAAQDRYLDWMLAAKEIPSLEALRARIKGAPTKRALDAQRVKTLLASSKLPTSSDREVNVDALEAADLEALDEAYQDGVFPSNIVRQVLLALRDIESPDIHPELKVIMRKVLAKGTNAT
jgi:hypothetical protein